MLTLNDINEIYSGCKRGGQMASFRALIREMGVKPACPDCGGDCSEKNMAGRGEPRAMTYQCRDCKTWVYQPEWKEY